MNPERGRHLNPLINELAGELTPVSPIRPWHGMSLILLSAFSTIALVGLLDGLWHGSTSGEASGVFFLTNGILGLLGAASAFTVVRMSSPRVGNSHDGAHWSTAMLALLPLTALMMLGADGLFRAMSHDHSGISCFLTASGFGLLTAGSLVFWLRRGAPVSLARAGMLTGIAAGSIGSFAYGLSCPIDTIAHLGTWHVAPVLLFAVIGRYAIPPLVRW